ncbi:signal transducer and activator of transcription 5B-like isoform X2 [Actinia tenebrosa]|uniref:Signal transducer and activator of transcription n=1 Tax=Actinia tenebrosa TaxID=6105 RepID=A0A6P8GYJ7_ACTTE|nr:signal transducer and activator of transcription 5B-like isoform X2 [Actinia tenebrosa]
MTLIEQIQQLSLHEQTQLMQDLHAKYPDSLELTNAYTQLIVWIQEQPWEQACEPNNPDHCIKAKALMDAANAQLQSQGNIQGMFMAQNLMGKYQEHPINFVLALQELNKFMISLVEKFTTEAAGRNIAEAVDADEDAMDQGINYSNDPIEDIMKDLEVLSKESQENEELSKIVEQLKEQYIILFTEKSNEISKLEAYKKQFTKRTSPSDKENEQVKQIEQRIKANQAELTEKGNELTVTKRLALYNRLSGHLKQLQVAQNIIIAQISKWTGQQQRSLSGWPTPPPLDNLQPMCELHADLLCRLYQHIIKLDSMFRPALAQDKGEVERMEKLKTTSRTMLSHFLNKCFVIEKHSPQVLKTNTKFGTTLRHLIGGRLNAHIHPPEVICSLVSEKYVRSLYDSKGKIPPPNDKNVLNNKKTMEYSQKNNTFTVEFKNLSVTRANRQGGKKEESVCEEKRCLQFVSEINIGRERFTIMTLSFPTVITVHGNQSADAEATIIWDNSFSATDRKPFDVPEKVTWSQLSEALSNRWTLCNDRELTDENLLYIAGKLFAGVEKDDLDDQVVTRSMFCKEHLHGRNFTFWKWFFSILDVVKKNMLDEWRDGVIHGFINKQEAQDMLINLQPGTFLVRFSDSELGGVTIAYTIQHPTGEKEVWNLSPWTNQHLSMRKFSDRIKDLDSLVILYPGQHKDHAFNRYYSQDESATLLAPGEYRDTVLATRVLGAPGTSTPMVQSPMHPGSQGSLDMITNHPLGIPSSPPSICGETELNIGSEETVCSEFDGNEEAMAGILSNVSVLMQSNQQGLDQAFAGASGYQSGTQAFTPHTIAEDQWSVLSFQS